MGVGGHARDIATAVVEDDPPAKDEHSRPSRRRRRVWWLLLAALVGAGIFLVLRKGTAHHEVAAAFSHLRWENLPWLAVALAAEGLSFWCYALVQRRLLLSGGARVRRRTMVSLAVAATALTNLVPGGTAPASGWLVGQYRKRSIPMPLALWAVLSGGYAATVSILLLLLTGAAVAGLIGPWASVGGAAALAGLAALVVLAAHRLSDLSRWADRHLGHGRQLLHRLTDRAASTMGFRARLSGGGQVLALSLANWTLDVFVLIAAFGLLGLPIPWRAVLFAYAAAQVAGSLAPVPGGIGFVEGGMIGAFALAGSGVGDAVAATVIYRAVTCWLMAAVGTVMLVVISRIQPVPAELDDDLARAEPPEA
ncbi:MAG: lysylphosphatidylglycerol synthase transmembrane domain-containing protein [Acidimicrobiales bacterium]